MLLRKTLDKSLHDSICGMLMIEIFILMIDIHNREQFSVNQSKTKNFLNSKKIPHEENKSV
jgi:hypothetical protein